MVEEGRAKDKGKDNRMNKYMNGTCYGGLKGKKSKERV